MQSIIFTAFIDATHLGEAENGEKRIGLRCEGENFRGELWIPLDAAREYPVGSKVIITLEPSADDTH